MCHSGLRINIRGRTQAVNELSRAVADMLLNAVFEYALLIIVGQLTVLIAASLGRSMETMRCGVGVHKRSVAFGGMNTEKREAGRTTAIAQHHSTQPKLVYTTSAVHSVSTLSVQ